MSPFCTKILKQCHVSTSSGPEFEGGMTEVPLLEGMEENEGRKKRSKHDW